MKHIKQGTLNTTRKRQPPLSSSWLWVTLAQLSI